MNDEHKIFKLYLEMAAKKNQPQMIERADGTKSWYLHGVRYSGAEAWAEAVLKERKQPHDDAAVDAFLRTILSKDIEEAL